MRSIVRFLRAAAIVAAGLVLLASGVYLYLLSQGVFDERRHTYGFKIAARVTIGEETYFGEAHTRCTANQPFPRVLIGFEQQGQALAVRLDRGRLLFVSYDRFARRYHPRDSLWNSAVTAPWRDFKAAVADSLHSRRQIPIDPAKTAIYVADDAVRPRELTLLDGMASALGPRTRIEELYVQSIADPAPGDATTIFPWG